MAKARSTPCVGININDKCQRFTALILSGRKTIETRETRSLDPYIGKRVGLIRTGIGKATLVGYATVGAPVKYSSEREFDADYNRHRVAPDSPFYIDDVKYGYPLIDVESTRESPVESRGIVARKIECAKSNPAKARSTRCGGRTVRYGAKGARVMPGTPKGDAYCARSLGQMRDYPAAAADPCSPLRLSRKRWACKGGVSMKRNPSSRIGIATVHNSESLIAPNPTPFGEVIFNDEDEIEVQIDSPKENPRSRKKKEKDEDKGNALLNQINNAALALSAAQMNVNPAKAIAPIKIAVAEFITKASTPTWKATAEKFLWWLDNNCPVSESTAFKTANKLIQPGINAKGEKVKRTVFSAFGRGNSKLPYVTFSTLPGVTCPGAGSCLVNPQDFPDIAKQPSINKQRKKMGGWCYSFKAWRYPAAYFRQLGNTLLIKMPAGRKELARLFGLWAMQEATIKGGETIRLYVDGDMDSQITLEFWMQLCEKYPQVRAYGYSKSWTIFLKHDANLKAAGLSWPTNYTLNLSEGSMFWNNAETHAKIMRLPITRHDFGVVEIDKADGKKIPQNYINLTKAGKDVYDSIRRIEVSIAASTNQKEIVELEKELISLRSQGEGVYASIRRLEDRVRVTVDEKERAKLNKELVDWKDTAALLATTVGTVGEAEDTGEGKPKAYIETMVLSEKTGLMEKQRQAISVPDEFWSRNPEYTIAVKRAASVAKNPDGTLKYPPIMKPDASGKMASYENFFVCPGKCGNCLGQGRHACGDLRLKRPIIIGLH